MFENPPTNHVSLTFVQNEEVEKVSASGKFTVDRCGRKTRNKTYAFGLASCGKVLVSLENTSSASFLQNTKTKTSEQYFKHAFKIFQ